MVRLVSAKPPKIDGVEGGSATPSSTPTPKMTTWDQVETRQQEARGRFGRTTPPLPTRPVPAATPAGPPSPEPRPRPDGATPPMEQPRMRLLGEAPGLSRIGQAVAGRVLVPDDSEFPKPWRGQIENPFGSRPVGAGKAVAPLTAAERFANGFINKANAFGSPNFLRGLRSGGKGNVLTTIMSSMTIAGASANMQREALAKEFMAQQYPKDVAESMAAAYVASYAATGAATSLAAEGAADATFMAAGAAGGALIGSIFFGLGAIPGAFAGAASGWAASRVVAGASAMINMVEAALSAGNIASGNGGFVNIPTLDDFWVHGSINEDGTSRNGFLGFNFRSFAAQGADDVALSAARAAVDLANPGRFLTDEQAIDEEGKIMSGHYATSADVDPKYDDYFQFIQEGYFVFKGADGKYKVDTVAVQEFLLNTVRYTREEDLRELLPPKPAIGDTFYKSVRLTDEMLGSMWDIQDVMP